MDISISVRKLHKMMAAVSIFAIVATLFINVRPTQAAFADVSVGAWYEAYVTQLADEGVVSGVDGKFLPDKTATRAELAKMLVIATGLDAEMEDPEVASFTDLPKAHWGFQYIETAKVNNIMSGYGGDMAGKVGPDDTVLREQAAKMIVNAFGLEETIMDGAPHFSDVAEDHWAYAYTETAYSFMVTDGKPAGSGMYKPGDLLTRAELAKMIVLGSEDTPREEVAGEEEEEVAEEEVAEEEEEVTVPTAEGTLEVAVASSSPAASSVPTGSSYNEITVLEFTASPDADVQVTAVKVTLGGFVAKTRVNQLSIWDSAGKRHGNIVQSLDTEGKATLSFTADPIVVPAGGSATVSIKVGLQSAAYSGTLNMGVASATDITSTAATVEGVFPVVGATHSVVDGTGSIGAYSITTVAVGGGANATPTDIDMGQTYEFGKWRISNDSANEELEVAWLRFFTDGTISSGDLIDFKLVAQDGSTLAEATGMDAQKYVDFTLATPYPLGEGAQRILTVSGKVSDATNNATRTVQVQLKNDYDIQVRGKTSKAFIVATGTTFPLPVSTNTASWFRVRQGTLTVSKASTSPSGFIALGADDVKLGEYDMKASGEDIEIQKLDVRILEGTSDEVEASEDLRGNIRYKFNGVTVHTVAAADGTIVSGDHPNNLYEDTGLASNLVTLSSYYTIKAGDTAKLTLESSIRTTGVTTGQQYLTKFVNFEGRRVSSNNVLAPAAVNLDANVMTVESAGLVISANTSFSPPSIVRGSSGAKIGSYQFQATAEDVNITNIKVGLTTDAATGADFDDTDDVLTGINNVTMKVGDAAIGTSVANPTAGGDSVTVTLKVKKDETVIVDIYADVTNAFAASTIFGYIENGGVVATGASSSVSLGTIPADDVTKAALIAVVGAGTLSVQVPGTQVLQQLLHADESYMPVMRVKVVVDNAEDVTLSKLYFGVVSGAGNITSVKLVDASGGAVGLAAPVATNILTGTTVNRAGQIKFSGLNKLLTKGSQNEYTLQASTSGTGTLQPGNQVSFVPLYVEFTGTGSGTKTIYGGGVWTAMTDGTGGATDTVTVEDVSQFEVGDWVRIDANGDGVFSSTPVSGYVESTTSCIAAINATTKVLSLSVTTGTVPATTCGAVRTDLTANIITVGGVLAHVGSTGTAPANPFFSNLSVVHDIEPTITASAKTPSITSLTDLGEVKVKNEGPRPMLMHSVEVTTTGDYVAHSAHTGALACGSGGIDITARTGLADAYVVTFNVVGGAANDTVTVAAGGFTLETLDTGFDTPTNAQIVTALNTSRYLTAVISTCGGAIPSNAATVTLAAAANNGGITGFVTKVNGETRSSLLYVWDGTRYQLVNKATIRINAAARLLFVFASNNPGAAFVGDPREVPVGTSGFSTVTIQANTSSVKAGVASGSKTFGLQLTGDQGSGRMFGGCTVGVDNVAGGGTGTCTQAARATATSPNPGPLHWSYTTLTGRDGGTGLDSATTAFVPNGNNGTANEIRITVAADLDGAIDVSDMSYPIPLSSVTQ